MHAELRERHDFNFFSAKFRISCGERYRNMFDDFDFVLRLTDFSNPNAEKSIEISKASYDLLLHHEVKIGQLIDEGLKAIIFQHTEVQLFVLEFDEAIGFQAHFENNQHILISLDMQTIRQLAYLEQEVQDEYAKYEDRKFGKKPGRWNKAKQSERKKPYTKRPYTKRPYTKNPNAKKPKAKKPYPAKPSRKNRMNIE